MVKEREEKNRRMEGKERQEGDYVHEARNNGGETNDRKRR